MLNDKLKEAASLIENMKSMRARIRELESEVAQELNWLPGNQFVPFQISKDRLLLLQGTKTPSLMLLDVKVIE